jgi:hypothetical protein
MDELIQNVNRLAQLENNHPGLVSRPFLIYIKQWLSIAQDNSEKAFQTIPDLKSALIDGLDIDFTGTIWETEWLKNGEVCYCDACIIARECISDIENIK